MPPAVAVIASVASAAAGVAGVAHQKKSAKKAAKQQEAAMKQQQADAQAEAAAAENRENLSDKLDSTGAEFAFGTSGAADKLLKRSTKRKGTGAGGASVGSGLKAPSVGGL
tara:strand:+ start:898 stop:1230 length:333 start_codon:yes stop_codon:yes gene_type:complete